MRVVFVAKAFGKNVSFSLFSIEYTFCNSCLISFPHCHYQSIWVNVFFNQLDILIGPGCLWIEIWWYSSAACREAVFTEGK